MPSDTISEGLIFQSFLGGMPLDPHKFDMFRMPDCVLHTQILHMFTIM